MSDRVRTKELIPQIKEIEVKTKELRVIVDNLPASSVKTAFEYSCVNIEKKLINFLTSREKFVISAEEKALLVTIREGKTTVQEVSTSPDKVVKRKH